MERKNTKIFKWIPALICLMLLIPTVRVQAATATVKEGTWFFYSGVAEKKVLDMSGASKANKGNAQLYAYNGTKAQQWTIKKSGSHYKITNANSGKALDVAGGSKSNGANIQQYTGNGTNAQLWDFVKVGSAYMVKSVKSGKVLDVKGGKTANKTNVWQYTANKSAAQLWTIAPAIGWDVTGTCYYKNGAKYKAPVDKWEVRCKTYTISSKKYGFDEKGNRVTGIWVAQDGKVYCFASNGVLNASKTTTLQKLAVEGKKSKTLLDDIKKAYGTPAKQVIEKNSCFPFDNESGKYKKSDYNDYILYYKNIEIQLTKNTKSGVYCMNGVYGKEK